MDIKEIGAQTDTVQSRQLFAENAAFQPRVDRDHLGLPAILLAINFHGGVPQGRRLPLLPGGVIAQIKIQSARLLGDALEHGGQIPLVTEGIGVFEMDGEPARLMQAGDVILIPPGVRHMHSAINDSWFAHIAISVNPGVGTTNWFEKVTDDEYNWESYDTVFIGYPIWWGIAAWPVNGFIEANDFTGKTVIPFCTSSSSGMGESG